MRSLLIISFLLFSAFVQLAFAQKEDEARFNQSKGTWTLPIKAYKMAIDYNLRLPYPSEGMGFLLDSTNEVKAVFEGRVIEIIKDDSLHFSVVTEFGGYTLQYSNLEKPSLKIGDYVNQLDPIGKINQGSGKGFYEFILTLRKGSKSLPLYDWFDWRRAAHNTGLPKATSH